LLQIDSLHFEALDLLCRSYEKGGPEKADAKKLVIKLLLDKGGVNVDSESDEAKTKFQEFLARRKERLTQKILKYILLNSKLFVLYAANS
jgi:hypothetical protein